MAHTQTNEHTYIPSYHDVKADGEGLVKGPELGAVLCLVIFGVSEVVAFGKAVGLKHLVQAYEGVRRLTFLDGLIQITRPAYVNPYLSTLTEREKHLQMATRKLLDPKMSRRRGGGGGKRGESKGG